MSGRNIEDDVPGDREAPLLRGLREREILGEHGGRAGDDSAQNGKDAGHARIMCGGGRRADEM